MNFTSVERSGWPGMAGLADTVGDVSSARLGIYIKAGRILLARFQLLLKKVRGSASIALYGIVLMSSERFSLNKAGASMPLVRATRLGCCPSACIAIRSHFVENRKLVEELLKLSWSPQAINFNAQKSVIVSHISDRLAASLMRH